MLTRRTFSALVCSSLLCGEAYAQSSDDMGDVIPPLPKAMRPFGNDMPRNLESDSDDQPTGFGNATSAEQAIAEAILKASPSATVPFTVAKYFHDIALGALGPEKQAYTRAWPSRAPANPLIRAFFKQTHTVPSGDVTAWCAAFMNWCIVRAYQNRSDRARLYAPPRSASSSSFRTWGKTISLSGAHAWSTPPRPGDIVVFARALASGHLHPSEGHVAFFVRQEGNSIFVLGGNQFDGHPPIHCINIKRLKIFTPAEGCARKLELEKAGSKRAVLAVHSIRTARSLHEAKL